MEISENKPPYLPFQTFMTVLAGWADQVPSRIDKSLFRSFSGATQSWIIATLKRFGLITELGVPTERLRKLVKAEGEDRAEIFGQMIDDGYEFVFANNLLLAEATTGQIEERFREAGLSGDTVRKAVTLFLAMCREAGWMLSPFIKAPNQRSASASPRTKKSTVKKFTIDKKASGDVALTPPLPSAKKPSDMLYDMLDLDDMSEEEQQAVWTLLRYLKKRGS